MCVSQLKTIGGKSRHLSVVARGHSLANCFFYSYQILYDNLIELMTCTLLEQNFKLRLFHGCGSASVAQLA